jgi:hypothetical protein
LTAALCSPRDAGCPLLCLLLVGAGEASRVAGGDRWCVCGRCRLTAALPAAGGFWWVRGKRQCWGHFHFIYFYFYFLFYFIFFDRWHFGGKGNLDGRLEYSFKNDGIIGRGLPFFLLRGPIRKSGSWRSAAIVQHSKTARPRNEKTIKN